MRICLLFVLIGNVCLSQEARVRILSESKIGDSLMSQTAELTIVNNSSHSICVRISTGFAGIIVSEDTIELGSFKSQSGCLSYDLWLSKSDKEQGYNDLPRYPLVINSRTCFVAYIRMLRNIHCRDLCLEYAYIDQPDADYGSLTGKYLENHVWDNDPKLKYKTKTVCF